jgi:hypothetical protein
MHPDVAWELAKIRHRELLSEAARIAQIRQVRRGEAGLVHWLRQKTRVLEDVLCRHARRDDKHLQPRPSPAADLHSAEPAKRAA